MRPFWVTASAVGVFMWSLWFFSVSVTLSSFFQVRPWSATYWLVAVAALMPGFAAAVLPGLAAALGKPITPKTLGWAAVLLLVLAAVSFLAGGMWLLPVVAMYLYARHRVAAST